MKDIIKPIIISLVVVVLYHFVLRGMLEKFTAKKEYKPVAAS